MSKLEKIVEGDNVIGYMFYCPGCESHHAPYVKPFANDKGASWEFYGSLKAPTFFPSILSKVTATNVSLPVKICHLFVREGKIEYLSDSTHSLAGKIIDMEEI
jgi:hypothetical protein